ncbi:MAG: undecaprenyl-phosphate galactose phosphotransferase WbaP [Bdellovibrionales bacterium]
MFQLHSEKKFIAEKARPSQPPVSRSAFSTVRQAFPDFQSRLRISGRWILAADMTALLFSYLGGVAVVVARHLYDYGIMPLDIFNLISPRSFTIFWAIGLTVLLWLDSRGHYRQRLPYWEAVGNILGAASVGFIASGFIEFASHNISSRLWIVFCWVLFAAFSLINRSIVRRHLEKAGMWSIPAIVIGDGSTSAEALKVLSGDKHLGFKIVEQLPPAVLSNMKRTSSWKQVLMLHDASYVFLALEGSDIERYQSALKSLPRARVPCSIIPPWLGLPSSTMTSHHFMMRDVMMMHDTNRLKLPLPRLIKRVVDVVGSSVGLLLLSPLFAVVTLIIRRDGGPAFFTQARVGQEGRLFQCYKFRSMRIDAEEVLARTLAADPAAAEEWNKFQKLKNDVRVTKFGEFIRKTSIDELPQLINVLKGDMSLVGPRPCMEGQEDFYAEDFGSYEAVRPGITGPWQVSGRNQLTFKERVSLEAWYARNWSVWLDIVIILKTFPTLLKRGQAF